MIEREASVQTGLPRWSYVYISRAGFVYRSGFGRWWRRFALGLFSLITYSIRVALHMLPLPFGRRYVDGNPGVRVFCIICPDHAHLSAYRLLKIIHDDHVHARVAAGAVEIVEARGLENTGTYSR